VTAKLAALALLAVPFASGLVFSPRLTLEQYSSPKLAAILVLLGVMGMARPGAFRPGRLARWPALAAWLAAVAVSTALSSSPLLSFIGAHPALNGFLSAAACVLLFMGATAESPGFAPRFHAAVLAAGALAAAYAAAGAAGFDPFRGGLFRNARAFAGNPDFLAQQLAMALPFAVASALKGRAPLYLPLAALLAAALSLSASRAGLLAAVSGVALVAVHFRSDPRGRSRFAAVLFALVAGFIAGETLQSPSTSAGARLAGLAEPGAIMRNRGTMWMGVMAVIRERPLLGHGPDALGTAFLRHAPPGWAAMEGAGITVERAHDSILEEASAAGLIGLGLIAWFISGWAANPSRFLATPGTAAASAAVLAYAVQNLFSFGTPATAPVLWVLLGSLQGTGRLEGGMRTGAGISAVVRCAFACLALFGTVRFWAGGWAYRGNEAGRIPGGAEAAPEYWRSASALAPFETAYLTRYGAALEASGRFEEALLPYARAVARMPDNGLALGNLGRARFSAGLLARDRPMQEAALEEMARAAGLFPSQPSLWLAAIEASRRLGKKELKGELSRRMQEATAR
jgi:O-antigen ligase